MIHNIVQVGHPVLRDVAPPIDLASCATPEFKQLIADMRETMHDAPGVGLAAPQIALGLRLFVIEDDSEYLDEIDDEVLEEFKRERVPFYVMINPTVTPIGTETETHYEGCLSVNGFRALVPRALDVHVEGWNENGEQVSFDAHGWHARILQHEFDHLNGTVYIDRMDTRSFTTEDNLELLTDDEEEF